MNKCFIWDEGKEAHCIHSLVPTRLLVNKYMRQSRVNGPWTVYNEYTGKYTRCNDGWRLIFEIPARRSVGTCLRQAVVSIKNWFKGY